MRPHVFIFSYSFLSFNFSDFLRCAFFYYDYYFPSCASRWCGRSCCCCRCPLPQSPLTSPLGDLRLLTIKSHAAFLVSIITETKNTRSQNEAQTKRNAKTQNGNGKRRRTTTQNRNENNDTSSNVSCLLFILFCLLCLSSVFVFLYIYFFEIVFYLLLLIWAHCFLRFFVQESPIVNVCVCSLFLHFAFAQIVN